MTRDDILRMAREADLTYIPNAGWVVGSTASLDRFAALVAAHEREACAKVVESTDADLWWDVSAAIRARGSE